MVGLALAAGLVGIGVFLGSIAFSRDGGSATGQRHAVFCAAHAGPGF